MKKRTVCKVLLTLLFASMLKAQEENKDTLYFNYEKDYLKAYNNEYEQGTIYLKDSSDAGQGTFFFQATDTLFHLNPKKVLCLKEFVRSSKFYNKHKTKKLDDYRLAVFLDSYQIFLVKENENKKYYLDVFANFIIE